MYMKDPEGVGYVIDRDKLTPELREKYDIQGKGLLSVEDEGISANDFKEFLQGTEALLLVVQQLVLQQQDLGYQLPHL